MSFYRDEAHKAYIEKIAADAENGKPQELMKVAKKGDVEANFILGNLIWERKVPAYEGMQNPEVHYDWEFQHQAHYRYLDAAEKGHVGAMVNLGFYFDKNEQKEKAAQWYVKAAKLGDEYAQKWVEENNGEEILAANEAFEKKFEKGAKPGRRIGGILGAIVLSWLLNMIIGGFGYIIGVPVGWFVGSMIGGFVGGINSIKSGN